MDLTELKDRMSPLHRVILLPFQREPNTKRRILLRARALSDTSFAPAALSALDGKRSVTAALRVLVLFLALVFGPAASAEEQAPATPPKGGDRVEITKSESSWNDLADIFLGNTPAAAFSQGSMFVVSGELRNVAAQDLHHVLLRYELLDKDGKVLLDLEGYNQGAESLRPDTQGTVRAEKIVPLAAGGTDKFRMVFFPEETPRFEKHRVRIVSAWTQAEWEAQPKGDQPASKLSAEIESAIRETSPDKEAAFGDSKE